MQVGVIGINHKSAQLQFREVFAKVCQRRFGTHSSIGQEVDFLLLSTCNRTEIYFHSGDLAATHSYFLRLMRQDIQEEFEHKLYTYFGSECFLHLARVTAGLDSALLLETEIQGQVKQAYEMASAQKELGSELHFMFQKSLKIGKDIRAGYPVQKGVPNLEETIAELADQYLGDLCNQNVLFVGASEINCKIFRYFKSKVKSITFCNRSPKRLYALLEQEAFEVLPWEKIENWVNYDLILFATKSPEYIVSSAISQEKKKLLIDLSVPRNVNPLLAKQFTLLNVDQLNTMINRRRMQKAKELAYIEKEVLLHAVKKQISIFLQKEESRILWFAKLA